MLSIGMQKQRFLSLSGSRPFNKLWPKVGLLEIIIGPENVRIVRAAMRVPTRWTRDEQRPELSLRIDNC